MKYSLAHRFMTARGGGRVLVLGLCIRERVWLGRCVRGLAILDAHLHGQVDVRVEQSVVRVAHVLHHNVAIYHLKKYK